MGTKHIKTVHVMCYPHNVGLPHEQLHGTC